MLLAARKFSDAIKIFRNFQEKGFHKTQGVDFKASSDFQKLKKSCVNLLAAVYELKHLRYSQISAVQSLYTSRNFIIRMIDMINDETSAENFIAFIMPILDSIRDYDLTSPYTHAFDYQWLDNIKNNDFNTKIMADLVDAVKLSKNRTITVLSTDCHRGGHLFNIKSALFTKGIPSKTFAICQDANISKSEYDIDRLIYGNDKFVVSNNVFDIVMSSPAIYLAETEAHTMGQKYSFFTKSILYLRSGGIYILKLPFYRLDNYLATLIYRNLENVQFIYSANEFLYIAGTKRHKRLNTNEINSAELDKFNDVVLNFENVSNDEVIVQSFSFPNLPPNYLEVDKFRGGEISDSEINELYQKTAAFEDFWKVQQNSFDSQVKQRPLLPFTIGQIGLILTSGFLDGVIDEGNGFKHLIKGRVKKFVESNADIESQKNKMNVVEVTGNRVEINVFLPDGTFKELI